MGSWIIGYLLACTIEARADIGSKQPFAADFQSLITNSGQERSQIEDRIQKSLSQKAEVKLSDKDEKDRIVDFVDVEIGWGKAPPVVDRRFDSVDGPTYDQK